MYFQGLSCLAVFIWAPLLQTEPPSEQGAVESTVATSAAEAERVLRPPPQSAEQFQTRIGLSRERIEALTHYLESVPRGEDEASIAIRQARQELLNAWQNYLQGLERARQLKGTIDSRSSPEHLESLTQQVARIEQETQAIKNAPVPLWVTEEDVQSVAETVRALEAETTGLAETQSRRSARINEGIPQQKAQLEAELQELERQRSQLDEAAVGPDETGSPELLQLKRRRLDVQSASVELALQTLPLARQETELLLRQDEPLLAVMRKKLDAFKKRASQLAELRSRSRIDALTAQRERASSPVERALLDLQLFVERVLLHYFREPQRWSEIQRRFPERRAERLTERIEGSATYWERALAALETRAVGDALELQQQVGTELTDFGKRRAEVQTKLVRTLDELQELEAVRDQAARRLTDHAEEVKRAAQALDASERTRANQEAARIRTRFEEVTRAAIAEIDGVANRLTATIHALDDHMARLNEIERRVRWMRLGARDSGLLRADYRSAWRDLQALFLHETQVPAPGEAPEESALLAEQLFGARSDTRAGAESLYNAARGAFVGISALEWAWAGALIAVLIAVGYVVYRLARRRGVWVAREIIEQYGLPEPSGLPVGAGLSARVNLLGWNMVADLAIPVCAAGAIGLVATGLVGQARVRWVLITLLGCITGTILLLRLVHHLFEADAPAHRPVHCNDVVARHYRWFLSLLALWCFALLTPGMLLNVAVLAPSLQAVLLELFKTGFLLIVVLFLVRKGRVLGGRPGTFQWRTALLSVAYPLVLMGTVLLLTLEVVGFGALVAFVGRGVLLTAGILIIVGTAMEYLVDLIDRRARLPAPLGSAEHSEHGDVQIGDEQRSFLAPLLVWAARLAGAVAVVLLVLRVWGVSIPREWLNWRAIGLSALVVLLAVLLDRIATSALRALKESGRLPESTANISCRWVRSLLLLLALLAIVAIAGFEVGSIWQFVTALLAMVAIGFVAVWSMLSNVLATLVILIWRPFNVGEWIVLLPEEIEGQVVDINFIYTFLRAEDGTRTAVPNNLFAQKFIRRQAVRGVPRRTLAEQLEASKPLK